MSSWCCFGGGGDDDALEVWWRMLKIRVIWLSALFYVIWVTVAEVMRIVLRFEVFGSGGEECMKLS